MGPTLRELSNEYADLLDLAQNAVDPDDIQAFADTLESIGGELNTKLL